MSGAGNSHMGGVRNGDDRYIVEPIRLDKVICVSIWRRQGGNAEIDSPSYSPKKRIGAWAVFIYKKYIFKRGHFS